LEAFSGTHEAEMVGGILSDDVGHYRD
jgi:hypothetical protein